ncbi:hypothetical protein B0T14DRAFT_523454, partial [Immersiella caudata]
MVYFLLEVDADFYQDAVQVAKNNSHIVIADILEEHLKQRTTDKRFMDSSDMVI